MKLNEIADNPGARKKRKRVGRGIGSGSGSTSGRGDKGQNSRSGVSLLGFEGGQMPLYRRLPKRGFNNPFRKHFAELNIGALQKAIDAGKIDAKATITEEALVASGVVRRRRDGIRLLAKGELTAKVTIEVTGASKAAVVGVEMAGGSVVLPTPKEKLPGKGKRRDRIKAERAAKAAQREGDEGEAKSESKKYGASADDRPAVDDDAGTDDTASDDAGPDDSASDED
jgi:large subunit ribosomal protein L15